MASSTVNARPIKRKSGNLSPDPPYVPNRQLKRAKSENVSLLKRYLIGCAHLIYVRSDTRDRDDEENLIPLSTPLKKAYAPSSDLPQKDMVALYFDDIDRTVVSQSKSKSHVFAPPDWSIMEPYLFPWIHFNNAISHVVLTRNHIKHVAFRIWEHLAIQERVVIKYDEDSGLENLPLGDVRGWWWETDGDVPRNYNGWFIGYDGSLPDDYRNVLMRAMAKPWPVRVSTIGLMVDANTPAPSIQYEATPPPSMNCPPRQRSYLDIVTPDVSSSSRPARLGAAPGPSQPMFQGSRTQPKPQQSRGSTANGISKLMSYAKPDIIYTKAPAVPPPSLPLPADVGDWFGVPTTTSLASYNWQPAPAFDLYDGSRSLSSSESYVPSLLDVTRLDLRTPPTPEELVPSPPQFSYENIVRSNFDPTVHFDKFWLIKEANPQIVPGPLGTTEVVEPSTKNENLSVAQISHVITGNVNDIIVPPTTVPTHLTVCPETNIVPKVEVTPPANNSESDNTTTPASSESNLSDPCLFQAEPDQDVSDLHDLVAASTQVQPSSPLQYFSYDQTTATSPPHEDFATGFSYADYLTPALGLDCFQLEGWDDPVNGRGNSQFFDDIFYH